MLGRILAVDPGEKRIGLAVSDLTGTIANPFKVIIHVSRSIDAAQIVQIAVEEQVRMIIVGQALDSEGLVGFKGRSSVRLADALRLQTDIPIELWDESGSTNEAQTVRISMGVSKRKRAGHLDDLAAAIILQSYLDAHA